MLEMKPIAVGSMNPAVVHITGSSSYVFIALLSQIAHCILHPFIHTLTHSALCVEEVGASRLFSQYRIWHPSSTVEGGG